MDEVGIVGIDPARHVFRLHGARADGTVASGRKLRRGRVLSFLARHPRRIVATEACASAHRRGRETGAPGHDVGLIAPACVTAFVKRRKNDMADAEAIVEAASRPTMRFVAVKSADGQAAGPTLKTPDLLVRRRTRAISALRAHLAEDGRVAPQGVAQRPEPEAAMRDAGPSPPEAVTGIGRELVSHIRGPAERIDAPSARPKAEARRDETARRLMRIPGAGPVRAVAPAALAPPAESFSKGRDVAARIGLVPGRTSSGGKARLGRPSKTGQRDLGRPLVIGAMSVLRWQARNGAPAGSWPARMLATRPQMPVAVAPANRIARAAWALMRVGGVYEAPASA